MWSVVIFTRKSYGKCRQDSQPRDLHSKLSKSRIALKLDTRRTDVVSPVKFSSETTILAPSLATSWFMGMSYRLVKRDKNTKPRNKIPWDLFLDYWPSSRGICLVNICFVTQISNTAKLLLSISLNRMKLHWETNCITSLTKSVWVILRNQLHY